MWETPLDKVIRLEDGRTIKTLADARDVILGLPEQEQQRPQWQAEMIYQAPTQRECPRPVVNLAYDLCQRRGQYLKVALIARFGGDVLVSHLRYKIPYCVCKQASAQACGIYCADLRERTD